MRRHSVGSVDLHSCGSGVVHIYLSIYIYIYIYDSCRWPYTHSLSLSFLDIIEQRYRWVSVKVERPYLSLSLFQESKNPDSCSLKTQSIPPAPMNHVQNWRADPSEMPFQTWYTANTDHFRLTDFCQVEIKKTTGLSNKPSTVYSCAEDQILENKISGTGF